MDSAAPAGHPFDGPHGPAAPAERTGTSRLDIQQPGDSARLVEHTFGCLPSDSLIVIGLLDGFTGGHMRIDLGPALTDPFAAAQMVAECLAGPGAEPAPEAAMVMLIGTTPASRGQDAEWSRCLEALGLILEAEYCVRIVQCWFLCAGHVRDPSCSEHSCCKLPGQPIEELLGHPTGHSQSAVRRPRPLRDAAELFLRQAPAPEATVLERVQLHRRSPEQRLDPAAAQRLLHRWDILLEALARGTGADAAQDAPELLKQLRSASSRDLLIPLATVGLPATLMGLEADHGDGRRPTGPAQARRLEDYASCFLGETGRRPDWERVDALEHVLGALVPYAAGSERENLLCVMAWIEWARGRGTAAGSFIDQCLAEFPENQFSRLIDRLMQLKGVCLWARVKKHSWSWAQSQAQSRS